jgi:hypothetical protein
MSRRLSRPRARLSRFLASHLSRFLPRSWSAHVRLRGATPPALLAAALLGCTAARADQLEVDSAVAGRSYYTDNFNVQAANHEADTQLSLTPSLTLSSRTERREVTAGVSATVNRFLDHPEDNSVDHTINLSLKWSTELSQWTVSVANVRDSTLNSELVSTGVVLVRTQRAQTVVTAGWQRAVTEKAMVNAGLNLNQTRYQTAPGLSDYTDGAVSGGAVYTPIDRGTIGFVAGRREYRTDDGVTASSINSLSVNAQWQYSERLQLSIAAGRDRTHTEQKANALFCPVAFIDCQLEPALFQQVSVPIDSDTRDSTYSATANYLFATGSLTASLASGLSPSGTGSLLRSEQAGLNYRRRLSETLDWGFDAGWVSSRAADNSGVETRYLRLAPSLNWSIDPTLTLSAGYIYQDQVSAGSPPARANSVFLNLSYGFRPIYGW